MKQRNFKTKSLCYAVGFLATFGAAEAATITHTTYNTNAMVTVSGIRDNTATDGVDLVGAGVTANYVDGSSETLIWQSLNAFIRGGVTGAGIDIFMDWQGFELTATNLLGSLTFNLAPASSLFDVTFDQEGSVGNTPTSKNGYPFEIYAGGDLLQGAIDVGYSGVVNLAGLPAAGDLYTTMVVDFTGLTGPLSGGFLGDLKFKTDMDTLRVQGDLSPVPLPAALPMLGLGLLGFGFIGRRRQHN